MKSEANLQTVVECTEIAPVAAPAFEIKIVEEHHITEEQKQILISIYGQAKEATQTILHDSNTDITVKITHLIGKIIKILENISVNNAKISGANKKAVALELGKLLIEEAIKDNSLKQKILSVYDVIAEQTLEIMIDVSRTLNTNIHKATNSCLSWLFAICCGMKL